MLSLLELALWKAKIDDSRLDLAESMGICNKKMKMDDTEFRMQCRISCGAEHVVENVCRFFYLPILCVPTSLWTRTKKMTTKIALTIMTMMMTKMKNIMATADIIDEEVEDYNDGINF